MTGPPTRARVGFCPVACSTDPGDAAWRAAARTNAIVRGMWTSLYRGPASVATRQAAPTIGPMATALFTGFPGFIGTRLLLRLLELEPQTAYRCLVQQRFWPQAQAALQGLAAQRTDARARVSLAAGDIRQTDLGLEPSRARALTAELTTAYHLAAAYDLAITRPVVGRGEVIRRGQ